MSGCHLRWVCKTNKMPSVLNCLLYAALKMAGCLTCCPGTPWWAAGHCQHPGLRCWHFPHLRFPSPEPRCLPSVSHSPLCEAGNYREEAEEELDEVSLCKTTPQQYQSTFLPDREDPAEIIHHIVELHLQVFQDIAGLHAQLKHRHGSTRTLSEWGNFDQKQTYVDKATEAGEQYWLIQNVTHIFSTHGFKHLLQLNSQLLDVVDQDAGLRTERRGTSVNTHRNNGLGLVVRINTTWIERTVPSVI